MWGWTESFIETTLNRADDPTTKRATRDLLAKTGFRLRSEARSDAAQSLFLEGDAAGIHLIITLIVACFVLRDEILAWLPDNEHRAGLSEKEFARVQLRGFAAHFAGAAAVWSGIKDARDGAIECLDYFCGTIDAVHELHGEIAAWFGNAPTAKH
jgi:hypothetical protein